MKIERKYLAHYICVGNDEFVRLGQDLEEFTPEMSASVEKSRNILGEQRVSISGYEKTAAVEPVYAREGSALYEWLQELIDSNAVLDELKTKVVDVKLWQQPMGDSYPAVMEDAYIELTSYGGDHNGYRIAFNIHYTGVKTHGMFDIATKTFTEPGA